MPSRCGWRWLATIGTALASLSATGAPAPATAIVVAATGECPARDEVVHALSLLLPELRVVADDGATRGIAVSVTDESDHYRVRIGDTARRLSDPARRCGARARGAAVVIALVIN